MVVVPTSQALIPSAVLSKSSALFFRPGSAGQRLPRMRPSMVVHTWQMTYGFMALHHSA